MRKSLKYFAALLTANFISIFAFAQTTTISGNVKNSVTAEVVSAASVTVKGSSAGTFTDDKGNFTLTTSQKFPVTLIISSIGYEMQEVTVSISENVQVDFKPASTLGQEVVIAATRTPSRILESPVSIERVSLAGIRNTPSPSYYDVLATLKGVDMTTSSFAFRTPSTRGFNGSGNLRFNQFVDGMDNQAPALNFAVGSIIGLTELDVESMELLPGASSALYGSGGMNGTLLINSKSPFKYQGLSFQIKQGVNHIDQYERTIAPYYDWSVRWAKKVTEKFAFKIGAQLVQIKDWQGTDTRDLLRNNVISSLKPGNLTRQTDPNYDGVNVFGDEVTYSMPLLAQQVRAAFIAAGGAPVAAGVDASLNAGLTAQQIASNPGFAPYAQYLPFLIPTSSAANNPYKGIFGGQSISRTGYNERDLVNYNAYNFRFSAGLNYKITDNIEASFLGYIGTGTSVYTGADRYSLKDLKMGQYKLELKSKNWFLRGYTTQENSGNSYTATTAAIFVNRAWKADDIWLQQYTGTYAAAKLGLVTGLPTTLSDSFYHATARGQADVGRLMPGTAAYDQAFKNAINTNISAGGSKFADKSSLFHYEGQLNLTDQVKFIEVLVGASTRQYLLNSQGTIFSDTAGKIKIHEYGAYIQLQKKLLNDVLKLTASVRYDKNDNFKGQFTPRFSALIKVAQDNNIRLSYQTAYRFPSTQDQYINLLTGGVNRLIGGLPQFNTFFHFDTNPAYTAESVVAYRNSFAAGALNPALLVKAAAFTTIRPESMQSYEIGYKGLLSKKLLVDVYYYFSKYKDFIGRVAVARGKSGVPANAFTDLLGSTDNYSFVINSPTPVKASGYGVGMEWNVAKNYLFTANGFGDQLKSVPANLITYFNTPKFRYNLGFANSDVYKGWGFNVNYRHQAKINWEGTFAAGEVPAYGSLDGMISYKFKEIKSLLKFGATNFFNKYYRTSFGNPQVGGLYYVSFGYNVF
ncbi:MAG: TonB-dependent receptor [Chitinophagaceae bacterium]|nr:TonB-dependent receptor [Chitinophagaceae bacterium]